MNPSCEGLGFLDRKLGDMLIILNLLLISLVILSVVKAIKDVWITLLIAALAISIYVILTLQVFKIKNKKFAKKFFAFASIDSLVLQVIFNLGLRLEISFWQEIMLDVLYNVGFCMLFVFWFKWFDLLFEKIMKLDDK